jgi:hypothetical protein
VNTSWAFWMSLIVGFLVLTLEVVAFFQNRALAQSFSGGAAWLRIYRWRYLLGFILGITSTLFWYPSHINGERFKVLGLPFTIMLLGHDGKDYVGTLTFPSFLADMVVWALIPDLFLWLWARRVHASPART